jgi:hypothetical protein
MMEYSIEDVVKILKNIDQDNISEESFRNTRHVNFSNDKRHTNNEIIYDLLLHEEYVAISKTNYNTFKILYEHPTKESEDFGIIIAITDNKGVKLITTYNQKKDKRLR